MLEDTLAGVASASTSTVWIVFTRGFRCGRGRHPPHASGA